MRNTIKTLEECIADLKKLIPSHAKTTFINYKDIDLEVEFQDSYDNRFPEDGQTIYVHRVYCAGVNITGLFDVDKGRMRDDLIELYLENQENQ